jgi:hypothetical protein
MKPIMAARKGGSSISFIVITSCTDVKLEGPVACGGRVFKSTA